MACTVNSQILNSIRDLVKALIKGNPAIVTVDDVIKGIQATHPMYSERDILDAMTLGNKPIVIKDQIADAEEVGKLMRTQDIRVKKMLKVLEREIKDPKRKLPNIRSVQLLGDLIKDLRTLAAKLEMRGDINKNISGKSAMSQVSQDELSNIIRKLGDVGILYSQSYGNVPLETKKENLIKAMKDIRRIQRALKLVNLDKSIKENQDKIKNLKEYERRLKSGELNNQGKPLKTTDLDLRHLENVRPGDFLSKYNKQILEKQRELEELKATVKQKQDSLTIRAKAEKGFDIMSFKWDTPPAVELKNMLLHAKKEVWELPRTLQFMFDASAFLVQLAPVVIPTITGANVNYNALLKGDYQSAFVHQKLLKDAFWRGFVEIIRYSKLNWKSTTSTHADAIYQEILKDPNYELMVKGGLKISKAKSLSKSEEFYKTEALNKIPVFGAIKDLSEDTMVATLNLYRSTMFNSMIKAFPDAINDVDQLIKIAETVNNLTGTTRDAGQITNALTYFMSAPRLIMSRLKLAFVNPVRSIKFREAGDKARAIKTAQMFAGYGALMGIAYTLPGFEACLDPTESCFLRIKGFNNLFDFSGGIGSLYRMMANMYIINTGVPEGASEESMKRWEYLLNVRGVKTFDEFAKTMIQYKLHPTLSTLFQAVPGKDFFGRPFEDNIVPFVDPRGPVGSRVEAVGRSVLPIFVTTSVEQFVLDKESGIGEDLIISTLQFFGSSSFRYADGTQDPKAMNYFNEIKKPRMSYPKWIKQEPSEKQQDWLKIQYKKMWGDKVGELLKMYDYDPKKLDKYKFNAELKQLNIELKLEFENQFKGDYAQ